MAVNVSAWVWTLEIPPYEKLVMLELADHADTKGFCFPKQATIAKRCRISRGAVNRIIKRLEAKDLLVQTRVHRGGFQRASEYRLSIGVTIHLSDAALLCDVTEDHISESPSVTPIETSVESSGETSFTASPETQSDEKEKTNVKASEVQDKFKSKSKEESYSRFEPKASGCAKFWRAAHAAGEDNGFQGEVSVARQKKLNDRRKELGDDQLFMDILWKVCEDWVAYVKFAESHYGAFKMGLNPTIDKLHYWWDSAVEYTKQNKTPVKSIAKPLTKQPAPSTPKPKAKKPQKKVMTFAEAQAAFEEAHKK